ncbi:MAG: HIT family protein [Anaerolineae bacterium]|jgi:histidine triad (HIT) family protein|nr:HIT family protein [Anaerolineae bacterium]
MDECVFCRIIQGKLPTSRVYASEYVWVILDTQPLTPGHMLVIPTDHYPDLESLTPKAAAHMMITAQRMARILRRSGLRCEGVNLILSDGQAAGQDIYHAHLHIIPRFRGDGFGFRIPAGYRDKPDRQTLDDIAQQLRDALCDG